MQDTQLRWQSSRGFIALVMVISTMCVVGDVIALLIGISGMYAVLAWSCIVLWAVIVGVGLHELWYTHECTCAYDEIKVENDDD
jgi:hypothetical protein